MIYCCDSGKKRVIICSIGWVLIIIAEVIGLWVLQTNLQRSNETLVIAEINMISSKMTTQILSYFTGIERRLFRTGSLFTIHGTYMSKSDYNRFTLSDNDPTITYIKSYLWTAKILEQDKNYYDSYCSLYIQPNCTINEYANQTIKSLRPVSDRPFYYPVMFAVPDIKRYYSYIMQFDVASWEDTYKVILDFMNYSNISLSERLEWIEPNVRQYVTLMNLAVYDKNNSDMGVSTAIFDINGIVNNAMRATRENINNDDVDVFIFDVTDAEIILANKSLLYKETKKEYEYINFNSQIAIDKFTISSNITLIDRVWNINLKFSNSFVSKTGSSTFLTLIIASIGIFIGDVALIVIYKFYTLYKEKQYTKVEKEKRITSNKMLNYINHELRNPLNVITGMIELTIDNINDKLTKKRKSNVKPNEMCLTISEACALPVDEVKNDGVSTEVSALGIDTNIIYTGDEIKNIKSDLHTAYGSCEIMRHIINDVLDIRRLEEDKIEITNEYINVRNFIKNIEKSLVPKLREKPNVKFIINLDKQLDSTLIYIDNIRLNQILLNFLTNSIKFTVIGSITLKIIKIDKNKVRFEVVDTGRGINDKAKLKIFDPFSQSEKEDTSRYGGVGLGLHLCKMLATCMSGQIGFTSVYGQGSTFWVEFPTFFKIFDNETFSADQIVQPMNVEIEVAEKKAVGFLTPVEKFIKKKKNPIVTITDFFH